MRDERYTLVTTTGEGYAVRAYSNVPSWCAHERFKVSVPVRDGRRSQLYRYIGGRRNFRNGGSNEVDWYNLIGFLEKDVEYDESVAVGILDVIGRPMFLEEFMKETSKDGSFASILSIENLAELKGRRPWLLREGKSMVTAHYKILPVVADVIDGWKVKSD